MPDLLNQLELADVLGVTPRQVRNLEEKGLPYDDTLGVKRYPKRTCQRWYVEFKQEEAVSRLERQESTGLDEWERRKASADARLAEIKVLKEEGRLLPNEVHERVVGEVAERLRAVLINAPSNYAMTLEAAGVDPQVAQDVLEGLTQDLTQALRDEAEAMEIDADDGDGSGDD